MHSDFCQLSSLGMSSPRIYNVKQDDPEESSFRINSSKDTFKNLEGLLQEIAPKNIIPSSIQKENEDVDADEKEEDKCTETSVSSSESEKPIALGGLLSSEVADANKGFRTPTSLDHKIPVITQCPPAPKKTRPNPSTKRKLPSPRILRNLHLDVSSEVESMFPPTELQDDMDRKIKKARTDDDSD